MDAVVDTNLLASDCFDAPTNLQVSLLQTMVSISPSSENHARARDSALPGVSASTKNKYNATIAMSTRALHSHMPASYTSLSPSLRIGALSLIVLLVLGAWLWLVVTYSCGPFDDSAQPLEVASTAPKSQERVYYLDNLKLLALATVYWQHGFAYVSPQPLWYSPNMIRVWNMYSMGLFAVCSGAVSSSVPTAARCQSMFTGLLLPCVFWHILNMFILGSKGPSLTDLIGGGHWSPEPWYLKALIYWRIALFMLGNLSDWALGVVALLVQISYCVGQSFQLFPSIDAGHGTAPLMWEVVQYAPYFTMGHILVKRRNLLEAYISWLKSHPSFRILCFALHAALYVDALCGYGYVQGVSTYTFHFSQLNPGLYWSFIFTLQIPTHVAGIVLASAWLPTGQIPVLSLAGTYTLQGYLFNNWCENVGIVAFETILPLFNASSMHLWELLQLVSWPVICVFACSEPVRFILWPFFQPSWVVKNWMTMTLEDICDVPLVLRVGFYRWLVVEVLVLSSLACVHKPWDIDSMGRMTFD
jgi:hypothetical protein